MRLSVLHVCRRKMMLGGMLAVPHTYHRGRTSSKLMLGTSDIDYNSGACHQKLRLTLDGELQL